MKITLKSTFLTVLVSSCVVTMLLIFAFDIVYVFDLHLCIFL